MPLLGNFGGRVGIYRFLQSPSIPSCRELFSFCQFNSVRARLQAQGLAQGTAMSAGTWVKCKKQKQLIIFLQFPNLLSMLCELSLLLNIKEGVEEQFPEVWENSLYEKLLNHLDKRELRGFGSTKSITVAAQKLNVFWWEMAFGLWSQTFEQWNQLA